MSINKTPMNTDTGLYLDTTPTGDSRAYGQIGEGFTGATPSLNPTVNSVHYINHKSPTSSKTGVSRQYALAGERVVGDAVNDYLVGLADSIGEDVKSTLVKVNLAATPTEGAYPAKRYDVLIVTNNDGTLTGGATQAIDVTLYVNGDATTGTFNLPTKAFTATP